MQIAREFIYGFRNPGRQLGWYSKSRMWGKRIRRNLRLLVLLFLAVGMTVVALEVRMHRIADRGLEPLKDKFYREASGPWWGSSEEIEVDGPNRIETTMHFTKTDPVRVVEARDRWLHERGYIKVGSWWINDRGASTDGIMYIYVGTWWTMR